MQSISRFVVFIYMLKADRHQRGSFKQSTNFYGLFGKIVFVRNRHFFQTLVYLYFCVYTLYGQRGQRNIVSGKGSLTT